MTRFKSIIVMLVFPLLLLVGCGEQPFQELDDSLQNTEMFDTMYIRVTPEEALHMMSEDVIILDVRTVAEFESGHIENAILLPHDEINDRAESVLYDKNQIILVYCRAGSRSATAAKELISMGYTSVYDFGGIEQWPGEIVVTNTQILFKYGFAVRTIFR